MSRRLAKTYDRRVLWRRVEVSLVIHCSGIGKAHYGNTCDPEGDERQHSLGSCDGWHRCVVVPVTAL